LPNSSKLPNRLGRSMSTCRHGREREVWDRVCMTVYLVGVDAWRRNTIYVCGTARRNIGDLGGVQMSMYAYVASLITCGHASMGLLRRGVPVSRKARLAPRTTLPTNCDLQIHTYTQDVVSVGTPSVHPYSVHSEPLHLVHVNFAQAGTRLAHQHPDPAGVVTNGDNSKLKQA
jgi:hypothetical protein